MKLRVNAKKTGSVVMNICANKDASSPLRDFVVPAIVKSGAWKVDGEGWLV
jgi:hypothetical protein